MRPPYPIPPPVHMPSPETDWAILANAPAVVLRVRKDSDGDIHLQTMHGKPNMSSENVFLTPVSLPLFLAWLRKQEETP